MPIELPMTTLYLVRVPLHTHALARWARDQGWVRTRKDHTAFDEGQVLHHLLNETFGVGTVQPFRLLQRPRSRVGNLYGYSASSAEALRFSARAQALPDHLEVMDVNRIQCKPVPEDWAIGQRIGFDVRVRPVRRLNSDITNNGQSFRKGTEIDAFLQEALREHPKDKDGMSDARRTRESVYLDWISERLAPAATVDRSSTRMVRFARTVVARGNVGVEGPEVVFHGTLVIADKAQFMQNLASGIGRHRAYGFGMLLLRAPGKPVVPA